MFDFSDSNLFLLVSGIWAVTLLVSAARSGRGVARSWMGIAVTTLVLIALGWRYFPAQAGYISFAWIVLFGFVPVLLTRKLSALVNQGNYDAAHRVALAITILHPFGTSTFTVKMISAMRSAKRGDFRAAESMALGGAEATSPAQLQSQITILRLLARWEEIVQLGKAQGMDGQARVQSTMVVYYFRALLETGRFGEALAFYRRMMRDMPPSLLQALRSRGVDLALMAFAGRPQAAQRLASGIRGSTARTQLYWQLTARAAAGENVLDELRALHDSETNALIKRTIAYRLEHAAATASPVNLSADDTALLNQIEQDAEQRQIYDGSASASVKPWCTWVILGLIGFMFGMEYQFGGVEDIPTLRRLGGLIPYAVDRGQWWRLISHAFLHAGWAHVTFNVMALMLFGPFVERAMGRVRFLTLYFGCVVVSGWIYVQISGPRSSDYYEVLIGASGAVMGLIGATAAIMLRGRSTYGAAFVRARLRSLVTIIVVQFMFDQAVANISSKIHFLGLVIGFVITLVLAPASRSSAVALR